MFQKNKKDTDEGPRYCKKCGCELVSSNKRSLCANCKREKGKGIRNGIFTVLGLAASTVALGMLNGRNGEDANEISTSEDGKDDFKV